MVNNQSKSTFHYADKFTPELIAIIHQEINALETNFVDGWNTLYPNLFNLIEITSKELTTESFWPIVSYFVQFSKPNNDKMLIALLSNGGLQLQLGAETLRNFLTSESPEEALANYVIFRSLLTTALNDAQKAGLTKAEAELALLKNNNVAGWNTSYPTLFQLLSGIANKLCVQSNTTKGPSQIGVIFTKIQRDQAVATILPNGTSMLIFGSNLISKLLFSQPSAEAATQNLRILKWIVAHEIGHLNDPLFKKYARFFFAKVFLTLGSNFFLFYGILNWLFPKNFVISAITVAPWILISASLAFKLLQKIVLTTLHHRFEYNADKLSTTIMVDFKPKDTQAALDFMNTEIRNDLFAHLPTGTSSYQQSQNPLCRTMRNMLALLGRAYSSIYKCVVNTYLGHMHPAPAKRISALKKLVSK